MLSELVGRGITDYSERHKGELENHDRAARFDVTDGFIGITQFEGDSKTVTGRVLLSPAQWSALVSFVERARQHRRRAR